MFSKLFSNSNKLETAERQIISLRDELKRTLERLDAAENSRRKQDRLNEQLETVLNENKNLENKIRVLTSAGEDLREEARFLKGSVRRLTKEKSEALEKLINQSDHENEKKQYAALELNNKTLTTNLDQLRSILDGRIRELNEVVSELKDARETNKMQSAEIQELRLLVDEAKRDLSVETSKKNEKIKNLESALSDSRKSLSDEKIKSQTWNRLLVDLKRDYDKLKSEESKLKIENEKLGRRVDAPRPQSVSEQQLKNACNELSRLKEKFSDLEQKHKLIVKTSKRKEATLQEELKHARQRNRRLLERLEITERVPEVPKPMGKSITSLDPLVTDELPKQDDGEDGLTDPTRPFAPGKSDTVSEEAAWAKLLGGGKKLTLKPIVNQQNIKDEPTHDQANSFKVSFGGTFRVSGAMERSQLNSKESLSKIFASIQEMPHRYLNVSYSHGYLKRNLSTSVEITKIEVSGLSVSALERTDFYATGTLIFLTYAEVDSTLIARMERILQDALLALTMEVPTATDRYIFRFIKRDYFRVTNGNRHHA